MTPVHTNLPSRPLAKQLTAVGILVVLLSALVGATALISYQYWDSQRSLAGKIAAIQQASATPAAQAMYNMDQATLQQIVVGLTSYPEITKAELYESGQLLAYNVSNYNSDDSFLIQIVNRLSPDKRIFRSDIFEPYNKQLRLGEMVLTVEPALALVTALKQGGKFIAIFLAINLLLLVACAYVVHKLVTKPLSELSRAIADLDPSQTINNTILPLPDNHSEEFESLVNSTNNFLSALNNHLNERHRVESELVTAEQNAEESRLQLVDALESIHDGFILRDAGRKVVLCNSRYLEFYPSAKAMVNQHASYHEVLRAIAEQDIVLSENREQWISARNYIHINDSVSYEETLHDNRKIKVTEVRTSTGGIVGIHSDVTELKQAVAGLRYRADFDLLTGLLNRSKLLQRIADVSRQCLRNQTRAALLFIDLDRFKYVNDTFGHQFGDMLLVEVGQRLEKGLRKSDIAARLGGDEFAVILPDIKEERCCTRVAEKLIACLSEPFVIQSREIVIGASIGISIYPDDGNEPDILLRHADMAMYQSKQGGRGQFKFFNEEMTIEAEKFVKLEQDLARAIKNNEFFLNYQPIMARDSETGLSRIAGVEVLVRWRHPERGIVPPGDFISVAEETGQIAWIGEWVLAAACAQVARWQSATPLYLSVNVSFRQFQKGFNSQLVARILHETGFPANKLCLEITESLLVEEDDNMLQTLSQIRDLGINIAIDDFGTGYSSLSYLKKYPINILKIDKSFVHGLPGNQANQQLVQTIIAMANSMQLKVVAEGVENPAQEQQLLELHCDYLQGFYYSKPMLAEEFIQLLQHDSP